MEPTYRIKSENADPRSIVIEKANITADFTIADMEDEQKQCERVIKELDAKIALEAAKVSNIEAHHPFVKDMSGEDLVAAHLYYEAKTLTQTLAPRLEVFKKQLQESLDEKEEIVKQFGLNLGAPTPAQVVDEAMEHPQIAPTDDEKDD